MTQSLPINADFTLQGGTLPSGSIFAADAALTIQTVDVAQCGVSMTVDVLVENI